MKTNNITANEAALKEIMANSIVTEFLAQEAREQVAYDIRAKTGSGTTAAAVALLLANGHDKSIAKRFNEYFTAGVAAAVLIKLESE